MANETSHPSLPHRTVAAEYVHAPHSWVWADQASRLDEVVTADHIGMTGRQGGGEKVTEWMLVGVNPVLWKERGAKGDLGLSAYQMAVAAGYAGTAAQWLDSLQGAAGKSAYQVAVDGGYVGTQAAWLASLKGTPGDSRQMSLRNSRSLLRWRRALARSREGIAGAKLLLTGTSSAAGAWANGSANLGADTRKLGPAVKLAQKLTVRGYCVAQAESVIGQQGVTGTGAPAYDPRYSYAVPGWEASTSAVPIGFALTSTTAGSTLAFAPSSSIDTFEIWYGGTGTASASVDGGAPAAMPPTAANALGKLVMPAGLLGAHALTITKGDANAVFVYGIRAYNAAGKTVEIIQAGWPGKRSDTFTSASLPISPLSIISSVATDLVVYWIGSNDWNQIGGAVTLSQLLANIKTVGDVATAAGGSFMICANQPTSVTYSAQAADLAKQNEWVAAMRDLADANGWAFYPGFYRHNSQEESMALGFYGDALHLNQFGYDDWTSGLAADVAQ